MVFILQYNSKLKAVADIFSLMEQWLEMLKNQTLDKKWDILKIWSYICKCSCFYFLNKYCSNSNDRFYGKFLNTVADRGQF